MRWSRLARVVGGLSLTVALIACATKGGPGRPERVVTLDQGWTPAEAARYHFTPQGTQIMPTAWLMALEAGWFSNEMLLSPDSMRRFGFIVDGPGGPGELDPFRMPVGFASTGTAVPLDPADPKDRRTVSVTGLTCAACHTGQLDYKGTAIRIEGGQANHDARAFQNALAQSVIATWLVPGRYARFRARAIELGYPEDKLDARFKTAFDAAWTGFKERLEGKPDLYPTYEGNGRLDALQRIANQLFAEDLPVRENNRVGLAPVSFPPLWDIWLFDWVQYNASVRQPMVRNVGEALGVRARTNFVDPVNGKINPEPERWRSTVRVQDIDAMERRLANLKPPRWPENVLGPIDRPLAEKGRALFGERCAGCHAIQLITDRPVVRPDDKARFVEWHVPVIRLDAIGTDPTTAVAFAQNRYDARALGFGASISAAEGLKLVADKIKDQAYRDAKIPESRWPEFDGFARENLVTVPCGYKARPLIGIWATPPFLHNGSVPSLADLLSEERPARFQWGSREFDPVRVGYVTTPGSGVREFDTSETGNSNAGHWFTDDTSRKGRIGPALSADMRASLIEYLKAATAETYPIRRLRSSEIKPQPCADNPEWAGRSQASPG